MTFEFYRQPRDEDQRRGFELAKDKEFWFHNWDPRVGKTKVVNDEFRYNYELGRVTALVVIAYPADVHLVWGDEVPKDFPPELMARTKLLLWRGGKMGSRANQEALAALLTHDAGPVILALNCEAILGETCWQYLRKFFARHRVMLVVDEDWATRWSARTKRLLAMGRGRTTVMRRLLSGTAADEGPNDVYYPTTFLKPGCLGFTTAAAFRNRYTQYEEEEVSPGVFQRKKGFNRKTNTQFDIFKGYCNLDELKIKLSVFSDRVVRKGSNKVYAPRYFTLTDKQRRVYDELRDRYVTELDGTELRAADVLKRMTRLQMVARNYYPPERIGVPCEACGGEGYRADDTECERCDGIGIYVTSTELARIDTRNPALEALEHELTLTKRPFVIWARFRQDAADAVAVARAFGRVALYDGSVKPAEREAAYHAFVAGDLDGLVATEKSGLSRGHDLRRARLTVYYSNEFSSRDRKQSEDRTESTDENQWTDVVDLIAADTRDLDVIESLRSKRSIAELINGDAPTKWL